MNPVEEYMNGLSRIRFESNVVAYVTPYIFKQINSILTVFTLHKNGLIPNYSSAPKYCTSKNSCIHLITHFFFVILGYYQFANTIECGCHFRHDHYDKEIIMTQCRQNTLAIYGLSGIIRRIMSLEVEYTKHGFHEYMNFVSNKIERHPLISLDLRPIFTKRLDPSVELLLAKTDNFLGKHKEEVKEKKHDVYVSFSDFESDDE